MSNVATVPVEPPWTSEPELDEQDALALLPDDSPLLESKEPEMESSLHYLQALILYVSLEWLWRERTDFFLGANLSIYFKTEELKQKTLVGPDLFVVTGTERRQRRSWAVWREGKFPDLIIELLSESTEKNDRTTKKEIYQNQFHTPEYFWFSPITLEFEGFHLVGAHYQPIPVNERGHRWSEVLQLFLGVEKRQLRLFLADGTLVPTPEEAAQQEIQRANAEAQRAEIETQRADAEAQRAEAEAQRATVEQNRADAEARRVQKLMEQLRALGVEPEFE